MEVDEKILNTAVYKVSNQQAVTGFLTATPAAISISAYNTIGVSYTINSGPDDLGLFDWTITKSISGAAPTVVRQGKSQFLSGTYSEIVATKEGDSFDRYSLNIKENNATTYTMISNDKVTVAVPAAALFAKAGYLDASIMSFVDVFDNVRKK
jgi:hypothetical protein